MKNLLFVAAVALMGFASCKSSTCPAYSQKSDSTVDQKVMAKTMPAESTASRING